MIQIKTTKEMIVHSYCKSVQMGELKNSIMNGKGNFIGFIGEAATKSYFQIPITTNHNTYDYDLVLNNDTIDVKSKKTSNLYNYVLLEVGLLILLAAYQMPSLH